MNGVHTTLESMPLLLDSWTHFASAIVQNPQLAKGYTQRVALSKIGKPEEIAGIVRYLASPDASFVTGQCMVVDGVYSTNQTKKTKKHSHTAVL